MTNESAEKSFDVIVAGSGFAGLSAAISAAEAGASVLVLEKLQAVGGNSVISDGGMAAPGTDLQKSAAISDSPGQMFQDMMDAGEGLNHPDLVKAVAEGAREAFLWVRDTLGIRFRNRIEHFGGHSQPRCYTPVSVSGAPLIKAMSARLEALHVKVKLGATITRLIQDDNGRVTGVSIDSPNGSDQTISAKAIIIATGGFGADVAFRSAQDPRLDDLITSTNIPSANAEMMKECMRIGANPVQLSRIQLGPWTCPDEKGFGLGPLFGEYVMLPFGILVNADSGRRFVNELGNRKRVADELLAQKKPSVGFADSAGVAVSGMDLSRVIKRGILKMFNNTESLAVWYGMNPDTLSDTIRRFNLMFSDGIDTEFGKPMLKGAAPIIEAPFYAMRVWPKVHFTMGGIQIDANARAIHREQIPIPGLYAAGEVTGGVHGASRLSCCAITECIVMGKIAGISAAS